MTGIATNTPPLVRDFWIRSLGVLLVLAAVLVNKWSVERLFAPDQRIDSILFLTSIAVFQVVCLVSGFWVIATRTTRQSGPTIPAAGAIAMALLVVMGAWGSVLAALTVNTGSSGIASSDASSDVASAAAWDKMEVAEDAILELAPEVKRLSRSVLNLQLPDPGSRQVFGDSVTVVDIGAVGRSRNLALGAVEAKYAENPRSVRSIARQDIALWRTLLDSIALFEFAKFYVIRGRMLDDGTGRLETDVGFEGLARMQSARRWIRGQQKVTWTPGPVLKGGERSWKVVGWRGEGLEAMSVERPLFSEVLDQVVTTDALARARRSIQEEHVLSLLLREKGFRPPGPLFQVPAFDRQPGIAVTDLNQDGFDDVYIMERWGRNLFFQNLGNGTFEEISNAIGLDIADHTSSALFADFDNDGDLDVFLGRTLLPSLYLANEAGRFVDRSDRMDGQLPAFASSLSAADYDNDGLLDVYVTTYAASLVSEKAGRKWVRYLAKDDAAELTRLLESPEQHAILNRFGPPNVLLKNLGAGRFAQVQGTELRLFKNSYQAAWADYDNDGDVDVYVANDFAPNNLFRNEGSGHFTDVTEATKTADIGFGMGVSWGDFDEDGKQDLYVTNMYSKAGLRITAQLSKLDPRYALMAHGNTLFRNKPGAFERVSGLTRPALLVEKAGWGWGSQFVDLDNDGDLDLYALSGYYTAPSAVESPVDI